GTRDVSCYGAAGLGEHAAQLFDQDGRLEFDMETLRVTIRSLLIDVLSCRENRSDSGIVARVAGNVIGADNYLPNMCTEEFLSCLSRRGLVASCNGTPGLPRERGKDRRAALVEHFCEERFVHQAALFAPDHEKLSAWLRKNEVLEAPEDEDGAEPAELDGG